MAKKMLIDATHAEETRVVVVDGNKVEEFDFESENRRQLAGNIYLAKVTRVEPSLQAAFVDYGGNRHGFLAFSEIHADYYQIPVADREALMAEEYAFAEAQKTQDEDEEKPKTPSRRRGLSESKATSVQTSDATTAADINGMETIDLEEIINDSDIDGNVTTEISHEVSNNISIDSEDNQTGQIVSEKISDKDDLGGEDQPDETIESVVNEDDSEDIRPTRKPRLKLQLLMAYMIAISNALAASNVRNIWYLSRMPYYRPIYLQTTQIPWYLHILHRKTFSDTQRRSGIATADARFYN